MSYRVQRVEYYYTTVPDRPGEAFRFLSLLAELGIGMQAFTAIPVGLMQTQLTVFPEEPALFRKEGRRAGMALDGPHPALLVQGDDAPGALVDVHETLYQANVNVFASSGVVCAGGGYGYVIYVRPERFEAAASALGI